MTPPLHSIISRLHLKQLRLLVALGEHGSLLKASQQVALTQPRTGDRIFPFDSKSASTAFTRAVAFLAIDDLHMHDLRHEGVSRLFELGWTIPQAATVSGHRTWASLKRYTHIRQAGDKYEGWAWLVGSAGGRC